jgi:hypothetical protein
MSRRRSRFRSVFFVPLLWSHSVFATILAGVLTVAIPQAPAAATEEPIHFSTADGTKRAEFKLNGNMECILENDRISCVPASK